MDDEQLKAWVCAKCGATLPEPQAADLAVACIKCGTVFRIPQKSVQAGGVQISGSNVVIHGDVVGGDRIVVQSSRETTTDLKEN
jgi:hypothetical protein